MSARVVVVVVVVAMAAAGCGQATLFNLPRDPADRRLLVDDSGAVIGAVADGGVEDVFRRAKDAGCTRQGEIVSCRSLHPVHDAVLTTRFAVGEDKEGHVVVVVKDAALAERPDAAPPRTHVVSDRQGLRRWLYTLSGGQQQDGVPPAPPLLTPSP